MLASENIGIKRRTKMLNIDDITKGMAILSNAFSQKEISAGMMAVYHEAMNRNDVDPYEFEAAVWKCIENCKFFPTIAEILHFLPRPDALASWNRLIESAEAGTTPVLNKMEEAALAALGGWDKFQFTSYDDLLRHFRDFKSAFEGAGSRGNLRLIEGGK
jgi:hypothetical protein